MSESDYKTPLPPRDAVAATQLHWILRACAKYLPPILIAVAGVITAGVTAKSTAKDTAKDEAKDTAGTVTGALAPPVVQLQERSRTTDERLTRLEADIAALRRLVRNAHMSSARKRRAEMEAQAAAAAAKAAAPPPPKLIPVPDSLEKAQEAAK